MKLPLFNTIIHRPAASILGLALCVFAFANQVHAQNPMFLSFDYPYKDVQKTLYKIEYLDILFEQDDTKIAARHGNMFATYYFDKGTLYNIELTKNYDRIKKAQEAYDGCMDYFLSTGAVPVEFYEDGKEKRVVATRSGKVYRLTLRKVDNENIDVSLASKFVNLAPLSTLEGPDFMELNDENSAEGE